jgi:hypothetical protein
MPPMVERKGDKSKQDEAQTTALVGRAAEGGMVSNALLRLKAGQSGCIIFSGQEGLGKTT